ncbi:MAG: hydroxymethylbilane synthase, partial [Desulfovibrio sp.]|nr:hydroxymethylbilane synthase [Desulfovibrio sp.]
LAGGKGLFVKEIEEALLDGRADLAVHSMKDIPVDLPDGLTLGAVPRRENAADVLLSFAFPRLSALPAGARVGTSSLRRRAQLLDLRPDLNIVPLRGNLDTRIRKLKAGECEAVVLAAAGLRRLDLHVPHMDPLSPPTFLPAAGQGALGLEFRADREDLRELLAPCNHEPSRICVEAERGFLAGLGAGCQAPVAAYALLSRDQPDAPLSPQTPVVLEGLLASPDGAVLLRRLGRGPAGQARQLGLDLAEEVTAAARGTVLEHFLRAGTPP